MSAKDLFGALSLFCAFCGTLAIVFSDYEAGLYLYLAAAANYLFFSNTRP